jgi:hypothetical protein
MNNCADSTSLRAHLDHPAPELDAHIDACDSCAGLLRSVAEDAGFTHRALALLDPTADQPAVFDLERSLRMAQTALASTATAGPPGNRGQRIAIFGPRLAFSGAVAVLVLVVAMTPWGRSAMAEALDAFRGERLQVVTVDPEAWAASLDPGDLQMLATLGEIDTTGLNEPAQVVDVAEAELVAGISAPVLTEIPDRLVAMAPGTLQLEFAVRAGNGVPAELEGASLVVEVPGAIGALYGLEEGEPEFAIGRSGQLVVHAEGATMEAIRSFILSRQELPEDLRAQLTAISDWRSTIPVPVPVGGPGWDEVEVAGRPAIVFGDDSGIGALVIRQDPEGITVVVGHIGVGQALELAASA